jgi:methyl-galactoside transport system substrate-binding protein
MFAARVKFRTVAARSGGCTVKKARIASLFLVILLMAAAFSACAGGTGEEPESAGNGSTQASPASAEYTGPFGYLSAQPTDAYVTAWRDAVKTGSQKAGWKLDFAEDCKDQADINGKLDLMLGKGYRVVTARLMQASAGSAMVEKVEKAGADRFVIFFKDEPDPLDRFAASRKAFFCGPVYKQVGVLEGQAVEKYMKANPKRWDKNNDGILQYVMLKGPAEAKETDYRTEYSIKHLTDKGIKVEKIFEDTADNSRAAAAEKVKLCLAALGGKQIEAVFANNDDMAIGAVDALKKAGYFVPGKNLYVPVVGAGATEAGRAAMREGTLLATSYDDPSALGEATVLLAHALANGLELNRDNLGGYGMSTRNRIPDLNGKYLWLDAVYVDRDNLTEFERSLTKG